MKFKDLLDLNKDAMLPAAERVYKRVLKRRTRWVRTVAVSVAVCAVAVIAAVSSWTLMGRGAIEKVPVVTGAVNIIESVSATQKSGLGMKLDSALQIKTSEEVTIEELRARLLVAPAAEFKLRRTGECAYELKFDEKLQENEVYNVQAVYNGKVVYRWAFQTESVFSVTSSNLEDEDHVAVDSAVEVTFSHADVNGFEQAFTITPALEGTFEHYGRTWAFVPTQPMESRTLYTVTVGKDVGGPDGASLEEDYRFSFTTAPLDSYAYLIYQQNEAADTFLANECPIAAICYNQADVSAAHVNVYRLADSAAFIDAYQKYVRNGEVSPEIVNLAGDVYLQFNTPPALTTDYNGVYARAAFINYPEPLPLGYYYAEIQIGGYKLYQLLESTTLSVYTITTNGDYTAWVNDTENGEAVSGAKVTLDGFKDGKTNDLGIVTFKGAKESLRQRFLTVENGEYPYVVALDGGNRNQEVAQQNKYYSYVATGSTLYRATDTVEIFGVILPRKSNVKVPSEVTLKCDSIGKELNVEVTRNGTFTASLPLNNTSATYGNIELLLEDTWLTGTHFTVADYELPVYQVTVTTDQKVYALGAPVQFTAQVTYMDGTPASGIYISADNEDISGYTDENGCFSGNLPASWYNSEYYADANYPEIHSLAFSVDDGTDEYYGGYTSYLVFNSPYFLDSGYEDGKLTVEANLIDLNLAAQIDGDRLYADAYNAAKFKGAAASLTLTGELHEITYNKVPNGTTYDAINKKVVYSWQYEEQDNLVRTFEMTVTDGLGTLKIPEKPDDNRNYYVVLRENEGAGTIKTYLTNHNYTSECRHTYNLTASKTSAGIGDEIELLVRDGRDNEAINSGSVLYTAIAGEITENFHGSSGRYTMKFKKEYAPDVMIYGAYFDGKHVYSLGSQVLEYDLEQSRLQIKMEKDQLQYKPGDEVTLTFKVTDTDGNPVKTMLNLSVLDRALYLVGGEFEDPLYAVYGSRCYSTEVFTTASHREFMMDDLLHGEGGGGGEISRVDFEDTPYFDTVRTDANGKAKVTFTLPGTITEWKVVARAVSEDVQAGMENFSLRSTQDYFAHVSMSETVKVTDDFTVAVKGDGLKASADAVNEITVGLTDGDGNEIKTLTASAPKAEYVYLNFGPLDVGVYTAYIQSKCGDLQDSVIKTFAVEKTQSAVWIHHQQAVESGLSLNLSPRRGNVTLTVVDEQNAFWQQAMARLRSNAGDRVDQVLGQYLADQFYSTGTWMDAESLDYSVIRSYMDYAGVKLLPEYENSDLRVSAKLAAVAAEFCDKESMRFSFEQYLNDRHAARIDVLISYFGLAALGEPVLADLQTIYSNQTDFTPEEAAYLALGFAYSGDYDTAGYIFDTRLKDFLVIENETVFAGINGSVEEDLTGCCALLSNRLSLESSEGLINFILETDTDYTLLNLELISYLNDHVLETAGENRVTVTTGDGRNESYSYQKMGALVLNLSPEQASNVRIVNNEGKSVVSYAYNGVAEDLRQLGEASGLIGAEIPTEFPLGEVRQITLEVEVPLDYELPTLDLILPAGLRFESGMLYVGEWEQTVSTEYNTRVINLPLLAGNNTVSIEVRGAMPGSYELEPIVVTNTADHRYIATDSVKIAVIGLDKSAE